MIEVIDHIDQIARELKRDVAGVFFSLDETKDINQEIDRIDEIRTPIINWLEENEVSWKPCFGFFDGNIDPYYKGDIYVHLEINENEPKFLQLKEMLENEDESTKIEGVLFNFYRYQYALNNEEFYLDSMDSI